MKKYQKKDEKKLQMISIYFAMDANIEIWWYVDKKRC